MAGISTAAISEQAVRTLEAQAKQARLALAKARAQALTEEVAKEFAEAMRDAPTNRVRPEGWGTEERPEGLNLRQKAAVDLVLDVVKKSSAPWSVSLLCHIFGAGEGFETWRVLDKVTNKMEVEEPVDHQKPNGPKHRVLKDVAVDVAVAGMGAPVPPMLKMVGLSWEQYAKWALKSFMRNLRDEIVYKKWSFPEEKVEQAA